MCSLRGHTDRVWAVCFSPDGSKITSGSSDETVLIWDVASGGQMSGEQMCSLKVTVNYMVSSVAYSPDGSKLAAVHYKTVSIFNVETSEVQCTVNVDLKLSLRCFRSFRQDTTATHTARQSPAPTGATEKTKKTTIP